MRSSSRVPIGVVGSILLFITLNTRPNTAVLARLKGTDVFRNRDNYEHTEDIPGLLILRIDASFYFANTEFLKEKLTLLTQDGDYRAVILDASAVNNLDSSADAALAKIVEDFARCNIKLFVAGIKSPVRQVMKRSGLYEKIGASFFYYTIDAAVGQYLSEQSAD